MNNAKCSKKELLEMLECMYRVKKFETKVIESFAKGLITGSVHVCIGQEAIAVGACQAIKKTDHIVCSHRGHGQCISKGAKTDRMLAELYGRETGYCHGRGGSMHVADVSLGILGANGIVGGGIPIAAGSGLASKLGKTGDVTIAFFGDGAANQGTFHESINMAAVWKLPVVFVCENNEYAVSTNIYSVINTDSVSVRAKAYNIPGKTIDGNDVIAVYESVAEAVEYARNGKGPSLIECRTYRMRGHFEGDPDAQRSKEVKEEWKKKDPVDRFVSYLLEKDFSLEEIDAIEKKMSDEIEAAHNYAIGSPFPDPGQVGADVYSSDNERCVSR